MLGLGSSIVTQGFVEGAASPPAPLLLNTYSGAAAAYSLRLLDNAYTGSAIRVRREDDSTEQDIGFDSNGDLDISALATFCAGTNGFVKTWYDQSGNGIHATQTTPAFQPKIYNSSTGVPIENGKPIIRSEAGSHQLVFSLAGNANQHYFSVVNTESDKNLFTNDTASDANFYLAAQDGITSSPYGNVTGGDFYLDGALSNGTVSSRDSLHDALRNTQRLFSQKINNSSWGSAQYFGYGFSPTFRMMDLQEVIIYNSDKYSDRTGIESNINTEYAIYGQSPTGFLADYSGAAAAYSLRQLISNANYAVAVRRDSDDAVLPIGFVNGELDTTTLADFCSGTDGFVSVWFDQSGEGNDATQTTTGNQPKIYDSSTGVVTENGKPAMQFDGSNDQFNMNAVSTTSAFTLARSTSFNFANRFLGGTIAIDYPGQDGTFGNISAIDGTNALRIPSSRVDNTRYLLSVLGIGASGAIYRNGSLGVSGTLNSMSFNEIGDRSATANINFSGTAQEIVLYGTDQSSNRTGIETNMNDFYSIY